MLLRRLLLLFLFIYITLAIEHDSLQCQKDGSCPEASHYILTLDKRDDEKAAQIALKYHMIVKRNFLDRRYFLEHSNGEATRRHKRDISEQIRRHDGVVDLIEDYPRIRKKRDYVMENEETPVYGPIEKRQANSPLPIPKLPFPDPLYLDQWYLINKAVGGYDMNVREAWLMGYAGRNVSISILDDGIQHDHLDLIQNYDPLASTDINDHDDDPTPQNNGDNKHGTRCAGEVSAVAGNNICGVGVAFHSKIGGVRMLDGPVSDSVESAALSLNQNHIDIYSASWGPEDDGKTFDGPGNLAQEAFYRGIKEGRGGRGNIFVWASGNGGSRLDSCSADGYTTSIYTLSISSATYDNHRPWYLEECPSTIATTYSSANINQPAIVTVDVPNGCTKMHTGTSASAPLAAGIIALALEANPRLTWRDTQHIVLRTANPTPLLNNNGWTINGVGRRISNKFGYGLMDAGAIVKLAKIWTTVPEQHMCTYEYLMDSPRPRPIMGNFQLNFSIEVGGCEKGTTVLYLEHVQVITTIRFGKRGDLRLTLFSPSGTKSVLLPPRPQDLNTNGFHKWPFLTVQMWGENPRGVWTLMVESISTNPSIGGMFSDWTLLLYGTEQPAQSTDPRYSPMQPLYKTGVPSFGQSLVEQNIPKTEIEESPITFSDVRSAPNCHKECQGCTESLSATACFSCKHFTQSLRNRAGFKCVENCDEGYYAESDKCKKCSVNCQSCSKAEVCETCHGAKLLIDVNDHYGHFDHGKCVDNCTNGLIPDYSNLVQAKCVLKKNPCSEGYYETLQGVCLSCDRACAICHGPGTIQCDACAFGYSNQTMGYCRLCCTNEQLKQQKLHECEVCTHLNKYISFMNNNNNLNENGISIKSLFLYGFIFIGFILGCFCIQAYCLNGGFNNGLCFGIVGKNSTILEYTPLNTAKNNRGENRFDFSSSSSSENSDSDMDLVDVELGSAKNKQQQQQRLLTTKTTTTTTELIHSSSLNPSNISS